MKINKMLTPPPFLAPVSDLGIDLTSRVEPTNHHASNGNGNNGRVYFPAEVRCVGEQCPHNNVAVLLRRGVEAVDLKDYQCRQRIGGYCDHFTKSRPGGRD